ncbi:glycosyltransferase family 31 protein [Chaetomium strumarium]|uniref:Glycosyltransferase family 31 protein n=1 Tax=Chaetomium strumarium TaxID=1170767 RepID=A0AAJ0GWS3_9PEZI|nr:glycosyltransferase family 31 protein [Chaetomium strumarium]
MMLAHQCSGRASFVFLVALLLILFLLTANRLHNGPSPAFPRLRGQWISVDDQQSLIAEKPDNFCGRDFNLLRQGDLALTKSIVYSRRCIRPVHGNVDRAAVTNISTPLITSKTTLSLTAECATVEAPPCEPLTLHVPPNYPQEQYPHLIFGVASSHDRLSESLPVFAHWLSGTGAQLVAVVSDADQVDSKFDLQSLEAEYRQHNIAATFIAPTQTVAIPRKDTTTDATPSSPAPVEQLHFLLIRDMLDRATPETHWLGVLDDDTFFPALHPLSAALREHDHTAPTWLGALADNFVSLRIWGYMAYGGAGTFLSVPLARQLAPHLESCIRETTVVSGDGMLRDCIYAYTTTKLTVVEGLYQHDIRGDAAGFFESGRRALSIHHWKSWYRAPVAQMAAVTRVCGDCFLQRWRFGSGTLLANGYSITTYRDGLLDSIDLGRVEGTWQEPDGKFDFVYGPFRPRLSEQEKKSYRLVAVDGEAQKGETFRQVYVHRAPRKEGSKGEDVETEGMMDEVVELIWEGGAA